MISPSSNEANVSHSQQATKKVPSFMRQRHIHKRSYTESVVCLDDQFDQYIFYVPKRWGMYWFGGLEAPLKEDGAPMELEDITLFCYIARSCTDPTMILSLDVGDVLTLKPKKGFLRSRDNISNQSRNRSELLVQIEDINFSPSGRHAEISVKHV